MINGGENVAFKAENVDFRAYYGGIHTNGAYLGGGSIEAVNCTFAGTNPTPETGRNSADSMGGYLATNHMYTFSDCIFNGGTGLIIKSGTYKFGNCKIEGTSDYTEPEYFGNGAKSTGNALDIQPTVGYVQTLDVTIDGGALRSAKGHAIHVAACAKEGVTPVDYSSLTIVNSPMFDAPQENVIPVKA